MKKKELDRDTIDRIVEMAWEDRTTFDVIEAQFGLKEKEVKALMRSEMKPSSYKMWRKRVTGRATKHEAKRSFEKGRFKSKNQKML
ncbi:MAG: TIGR03643 family protein [Calditrichota bacterium]